MSTEVLNNLLVYLQETLTPDNRKWLAERLMESETTAQQKKSVDETDYILSSAEMTEIIRQGLKDAECGNYKIVNVDEL